ALLAQYPETATIYLPNGAVLREGERLVQSNLAYSLEQIASLGARAGFYEGELAKRICTAMAAAGSPLRFEDFAGYQARWVDPISTLYRGHEVVQHGPN